MPFAHILAAQAPIYPTVVAELRAGQKRSHWMWFVFPQLAGLGRSPMAQQFALADLREAEAYLAHDILGARLRECTALVLAHSGTSARQIFGRPDDLKFRSSMTLFARAAQGGGPFQQALDQFCGGAEDPLTLHLLGLG